MAAVLCVDEAQPGAESGGQSSIDKRRIVVAVEDMQVMAAGQPGQMCGQGRSEARLATQGHDRDIQLEQLPGPVTLLVQTADSGLRLPAQALRHLDYQTLGAARIQVEHQVHQT
jgi:hypothetical protein